MSSERLPVSHHPANSGPTSPPPPPRQSADWHPATATGATTPPTRQPQLATPTAPAAGSRGAIHASVVGRPTDDSTGSTPDVEVDVATLAEDEVRKHNVYVGNLPLSFDAEHFSSMMGQFGQVASFRLFNATRRVRECGRAYAFCLYQKEADATAAVSALDGLNVEGAALELRFSENGVVKAPTSRQARRAALSGGAATVVTPVEAEGGGTTKQTARPPARHSPTSTSNESPVAAPSASVSLRSDLPVGDAPIINFSASVPISASPAMMSSSSVPVVASPDDAAQSRLVPVQLPPTAAVGGATTPPGGLPGSTPGTSSNAASPQLQPPALAGVQMATGSTTSSPQPLFHGSSPAAANHGAAPFMPVMQVTPSHAQQTCAAPPQNTTPMSAPASPYMLPVAGGGLSFQQAPPPPSSLLQHYAAPGPGLQLETTAPPAGPGLVPTAPPPPPPPPPPPIAHHHLTAGATNSSYPVAPSPLVIPAVAGVFPHHQQQQQQLSHTTTNPPAALFQLQQQQQQQVGGMLTTPASVGATAPHLQFYQQ